MDSTYVSLSLYLTRPSVVSDYFGLHNNYYCIYIVHLHHETTQCFIKQSRDFCILVSERTEVSEVCLAQPCLHHHLALFLGCKSARLSDNHFFVIVKLQTQTRTFFLLQPNKQLLIGTSIEVPECPPNPNIIRGKVSLC